MSTTQRVEKTLNEQNIRFIKQNSTAFDELQNHTVQNLDHGVQAFIFQNRIFGNAETIGSNILFVKNFYFELLTKIRTFLKTCLIGNPGTQKSVFQFYYLSMIKEAYDNENSQLPPDFYKNCKPPKIIIRQKRKSFSIYVLQEKFSFELENFDLHNLFCFDPEETLYLYEPDDLLAEPLYDHSIPTLSTNSPDPRRYKEFVKNGAIKLYMPCLKLEELKTIGKFLRELSDCPTPMKDLYSESKIIERFEEYGGIFRHVLPISKNYLNNLKKEKIRTIETLSNEAMRKVLINANIEDQDISDLIAQYDVERNGEYAFEDFKMELANKNIPKILKSYINARSIDELKNLLKRMDETGSLESLAQNNYETLIFKLHTSSIQGMKCRTRDNGNSTWDSNLQYIIQPNQLKPNSGIIPLSFELMEKNILYYPFNPSYPLSDFMYKQKDANGVDELCVIQVSREKKSRTIKGIAQLKVKLNIKDFSNVRYFYFGHPTKVNSISIKYPKNDKFKSVKIIEVLSSYDFE
jgi:hypothetical protein